MAQFRRWRIWLWLAVFSALSTAPCACLAALPATQPQTCAAERKAPAAPASHGMAAAAPKCERCPGEAKSQKPRAERCPAATRSNAPADDDSTHGDCACGCRWKDAPSTPQEPAVVQVPVAAAALFPAAAQPLAEPQFQTVARIAERGLSPPTFSPPRSLPARAPPRT